MASKGQDWKAKHDAVVRQLSAAREELRTIREKYAVSRAQGAVDDDRRKKSIAILEGTKDDLETTRSDFVKKIDKDVRDFVEYIATSISGHVARVGKDEPVTVQLEDMAAQHEKLIQQTTEATDRANRLVASLASLPSECERAKAMVEYYEKYGIFGTVPAEFVMRIMPKGWENVPRAKLVAIMKEKSPGVLWAISMRLFDLFCDQVEKYKYDPSNPQQIDVEKRRVLLTDESGAGTVPTPKAPPPPTPEEIAKAVEAKYPDRKVVAVSEDGTVLTAMPEAVDGAGKCPAPAVSVAGVPTDAGAAE
jgi:hypothetical protein